MTDFLVQFVVLFFALYVIYIIYSVLQKISQDFVRKNISTLIVIGSGGHTLEMIQHLNSLDLKLYDPRLYVLADNDISSEYKIKELEAKFGNTLNVNYEIARIPRSREVNQSFLSSIFTTLRSGFSSIFIVLKFQPDLILCNGPGTCIPICAAGFLLNLLWCLCAKIVYIESICRVKTLSLSGKILLYIADVVIVQWEGLHKKYPKTVYLGRLN